jgi:hypothetical protein
MPYGMGRRDNRELDALLVSLWPSANHFLEY